MWKQAVFTLALAASAPLALAQTTSTPSTKDTPSASGSTSTSTTTSPSSGISGSASASGSVDFSGLDTNKDGKLSKTELKGQKAALSKFKDLDADKDGNLSQSEFSALEGPGKSEDAASRTGIAPGSGNTVPAGDSNANMNPSDKPVDTTTPATPATKPKR